MRGDPVDLTATRAPADPTDPGEGPGLTTAEVAEPRKRRTQAERRASTRGALLEATLEVLVEVGYARLTTSQVVLRAGVTRGAQAHYFATKADLVVQALGHLTDRLVAEMVSQPLRDVSGDVEQYEVLLNRLWEVYAGPASTALLELFVASRTDPELRAHLAEFDSAVARTLSRTAATVAPALVAREDFRPLMVTAIATIRGLWLLRAVASERGIRRLWPQAREQLVAGFAARHGRDGD
ncbi:MAG: transcriptional regulator [Frankiales bacterium]|nr:transcriptional regulator [Frankiales bacterium]